MKLKLITISALLTGSVVLGIQLFLTFSAIMAQHLNLINNIN